MKRLGILAAAAALLCSCGDGRDGYTVEGTVSGSDRTLYLCVKEAACDSARMEKGTFRMRGSVAQPEIALLSDARNGAGTLHTIVFLEPGRIVIVPDSTDEERFFATGTPSNDAFKRFAEVQEALIGEYRNPATSDERRRQIAEEEMAGLANRMMDENLDNLFGVMMLMESAYHGLSGQEMLDEIARFSPAMQQTEMLTGLKAQAEKLTRTAVGAPYVDIAQPDADGKVVTLKSVVENPANRYVLLDFWASWCGPCMGEVSHLKRTYDAFHKKGFEIYGVSFDSSRDAWLNAVRENGMTWIHVSELKGFENPAAEAYAVQGIPTNLLIDHEGRIVARDLRGEELYEKVAELLN